MAGRRAAARRTALFLLYQWDLTGQPLASLYEGEVDQFAQELAEAVAAQAPGARPPDHRGLGGLDRPTGSARSSGTSCGSGSTSSSEEELPLEVAINEAVALAKRYASEDAGRLVNGILGRIVKERAA